MATLARAWAVAGRMLLLAVPAALLLAPRPLAAQVIAEGPVATPHSEHGSPAPTQAQPRLAPAADSPSRLPAGWESFDSSKPLASDELGRNVGLGEPLVGTSWLNRPYSIGWMAGAWFGDTLAGDVDQQTSFIGGYRIGWDFDHYWGVEGRWAFTYPDTHSHTTPAWDGMSRERFWDIDLVYYPWGDARWRPFFLVGLGVSNFEFQDSQGNEFAESLLLIPVGTGLKYYWKNWLTLRLSFVDNFSPSRGGVDTMHNLMLTGDVELRWGGKRTSYFPYTGSLHMW